jgi:TatD DNase family protein
MWIDTHCHLDLISEQAPALLAKAKQKGVERLVTIATDKKSTEKVCSYIKQYSNVYGTAGIHPHEAKNVLADDFDFIISCIKNQAKIVALGECGYDFHYNHSSYKQQKDVFEKQLEIALSLNYPVVVHSREAEKETMSSLEPFLKKGLRVLLHSFTSSLQLANFAMQYDCYFSCNGIITFPKSLQLQEVFQKIPLSRILIETDAPYLSPAPFRGKENTPANVTLVGEFLAKLRQKSISQIKEITTQNAKSFYCFDS